ncbi:hypothetical protein RJT34_22054 [Clitoria ternatea]|uniref:DUF4378 domain-containing protein n=1 Tax=Clitoria ternatea TaxID=43366 RepID=A0AAN9IUV8_CLITE
MTPYSLVAKDSVRSRIKTLVLKEIPKKKIRHRRSSTYPQATSNTHNNLLITFQQEAVSPLVYHFNTQHVYSSKGLFSRSSSFPQLKEQGKSCSGNKTQKSVQSESSRKTYKRAMSYVEKHRMQGNFDTNEAMMVRDANSSSGCFQGQTQKEIKQFKNLKQKIEHVTGESRSVKLRVTMDAVIHKLPQGHGISNDLKKEIFKTLTDPNVTRESEYYPERCNESDYYTPSFTLHQKHNIRRIWSLQEPLQSYFQFHESSLQSKQLKSKTEKEHLPLRLLLPFQRVLSLPDLQSFSYANQSGELSNISPLTIGSDTIAHQKKRVDVNVHSENNLQLDTPVENLIQGSQDSIAENDSVINNVVEPGSDCSTVIDGKVDREIDDFGLSCLKSGGSFNDQDIGPIKEHKVETATSDSKSKPEPVDRLDNVAKQQEAIIDSLKVNETTEKDKKVEIQSKQLNYDIPHFHVDTRDKAEFNYVKYVLEISGMTDKEFLSAWHSTDHPVDPLLYEEMESDPDFCSYGGSGQCNHHVLFDLINETLLELYGRSYNYCPIPSLTHILLMSNGCHILHQVWTHMSKSLDLRSKASLTIDDYVSRDLAKLDGWVNHGFCADSLGLELEDMILYDLLEEINDEAGDFVILALYSIMY